MVLIDGNLNIRPPNAAISSSVQYFRFEFATIGLLGLLGISPMLHTLASNFETRNLKLDRIHFRLLHLQQLQIKLWVVTWTKMLSLLSSFLRLACLAVIGDNVYNDMADSFAWT